VLKKKVERRSQTIQSESQTPDHKQVSIISSSNLKKKRERNIPVISFFRVLNIKSLFEIGRVNGCQKRQVVPGGSFSVLFGFIKKNNQTEIFLKKNRNRVKPTGFGLVWFFGQNPVQTGLALFSRFWLGFSV